MRSFASKRVVSRAFVVGIISLLTFVSSTTLALAVYYAPSILDPTVFSFQNTTPKVDGNSGALTQSVSLDMPPGRNGLQPSLSLNYNSQNTDQDNIVGYGWTLPIPYIARLNKTGSQNLYGPNAYFTSSFDGELSSYSTSAQSTTTQATSTTITATGSGTFVVPAGVTFLKVEAWGAGGGGGGDAASCSSGGGAAYITESGLTVSPGDSVTYVVGAGGVGGKLTSTGGGAGGAGYKVGGNGGNGSGSGGGGGGGSTSVVVGGTTYVASGGGGGGQGITNASASGSSGGPGDPGNGSRGAGGGGGSGTVGGNASGLTAGAAGTGGTTQTGTQGNSTISAAGPSSAGAGGNGHNGGANGGAGSGGAAGGTSGTSGGNGANGTGSDSGGGGGSASSLSFSAGNGGQPGAGGGSGGNADGTGGNGEIVFTYTPGLTSGATQSATYLPRVDSGSFDQYTYATSTNSWIMYDKKGTEYFFGSSTQSQQYATSSPSNVYKWMLEKEIDLNGNYIRYVYAKDHNQIYPSQIIYTGRGSSDGPMTITFATSTRSDDTVNYLPGFEVDTDWRLATITAAVNGNTVRQYNPSYTTGSNGTRSLLSAVQENGWDDNGVETTEPAMTFTYATSSASFVSQNKLSNCGVSPWIAADATGDGKNDSVFSYHSDWFGTNLIGIIPGGNGTRSDITAPTSTAYWGYTMPTGPTDCPSETGTRYVSLTGNGKADIVKGQYNSDTGNTISGSYSNNSSVGSYSWGGAAVNGVIPNFQILTPSSSYAFTTGLLGDVNGDGLPDYVYSVPAPFAGAGTQTYLGNGSAWNSPTTTIFAAPGTFTATGPDCNNYQLVDVNGDGLPDWVYTNGTNTYVKLNAGTGWAPSPDSRWTIATSTVYSSGGNCYDRGMRFVDVNGDGLPDFVRSYSVLPYTSGSGPAEIGTYQFVYLNTGSGWATSTAYTLPYIIQGGPNGSGFYGSTGTNYSELANFNGNGQQYQDVLATTTNPKGGSTEAYYGLTAQSGTNPQLPYSLLVVTKLVNHNGNGSNEETDNSYGGALQYLPSNVFDRKFAGFAVSTTTTPDATTVTYYSQGATSTAIVPGDLSDGYAQLNHPYRQDIFSPSGTPVQKTFYRWDADLHGSSTLFSTFLGLGRQLEQDYTASGTHVDKDTDYTYSTTTDNLIETQNYGQVTGNSDGTFSTTTASNLHTTLISYAASSSINLFAPIEKTLFNNSNATTTDSTYFYDALPFGQVNLGNQTKEQDLISTSTLTYASTTKAYNSFGLVASSTDRNGKLTSYVYDPFNLYPATTTNALSQVSQYIFNYANGKTAQTINPNGGVIKNTYDGIGRLVQVQQTNPLSTSTLDIAKIFQYQDNASPPSMAHETDYLNAATTTDTYDYYDGLSRLIQERKSSATAGTFNVTDSLYGTDGLLASQSLPYASSGASSTSATSTQSLFANYTYDALGRKLTIANAVGTATSTYNGWTTTVTDPLGHIKDSIVDAYGNLTQVVEHGNASNATTTYTYDAANNLTTITDVAGNVRNFMFDALGNRLLAQDLHTSGATTFGSTTYAYDPNGNLISQTDAKNQVITHTYDALNRMLTESWTGKGTQVTNTYDSCTNGIGAICIASSTAAKDTYTYDVLGRTTQATTTVNGTSYGLGSTYDRQGNVASVANADGSLLTYTYNSAGLLSAVNRKVGGVNSLVASLSNYSPMNKVGQVVFGSGASTTYTYNPAQLYRLIRILTLGAVVSATTTQATSTTITGTGSGTFVVPPGVSSLKVEAWGAGGGGGGDAASDSSGGAAAYIAETGLTVSPGDSITYIVASGGHGGFLSAAGGCSTVGTGFKSGGTGGNGSISGGGCGGGSTSVVVGSTTYIASGGGGGGQGVTNASASGSSGGPGDPGNGSRGGGGGGGSGTVGGNASGLTAGAAGTGGTTQTGTGGNSTASGAGPSSAGAGGNGHAGGVNGGAGSGGAAGGTSGTSGGNGANGTGSDSGGGGGGASSLSFSAGNGGQPGAGGGAGGDADGTGGNGEIVFTYLATTTSAALQDLNYTYDADGNIITRSDNSYSGGGQKATYTYDNLNRLLSASTTLSNVNSYNQNFTYDALGNILTGPNGSYSYQGTGNANPDAVTKTALTVGASSPTISYDNSAIGGNGTPASSLTFSYTTNSNTNGLMIVSVDESATSSCTSDKVTGVTYNGTSLTDAGYYVGNSSTVNGAVKTYYGYSLATSTNNIVVSASASCILYATAATYTGVKQSGFPDASGTGNPLNDSGAVTLFQATTTTANNNAWAVLLGVPSTSGTATAGSNTTLRQQQSGNLYYADSNGPVSPTGAIGLNWTMPSATHWAANYFSLTPVASNPGTTTTTLYTYDNDGNLTGVGSSTSYAYDFDNRLTQSIINGVTNTYAYDPFGSRIMQATASSTTWYPNKFVSITNATSSTSATSTDYLYSGSTLLETVDQPLINGVATGTPITRYIHTDNLGSTNITSDTNQNRAQWFDYAPYGSVIASTNTGTTTDARQYIGQFSDASGLSYLNARYYNSTQAQFTSEDPVFWGQQNFSDPQSLNAYSYSENNPITKSDPKGLGVFEGSIGGGYVFGGGVVNFDLDTNSWFGQVTLGPTIGPAMGGRVSGSYDANGSLDPAGLYLQVSAGAAAGSGASYSSEAPLSLQDGQFKLKTALPPGKVTTAFGAYAGVTDAVLYKTQPFSLGFIGNAFTQFQSFMNPSQTNSSSGPGSGSISQLSSAVVSYANTSGANLASSNFAAALKAINTYNANLFSQSTSASTPKVTK